jgi:hypothetical protein
MDVKLEVSGAVLARPTRVNDIDDLHAHLSGWFLVLSSEYRQ